MKGKRDEKGPKKGASVLTTCPLHPTSCSRNKEIPSKNRSQCRRATIIPPTHINKGGWNDFSANFSNRFRPPPPVLLRDGRRSTSHRGILMSNEHENRGGFQRRVETKTREPNFRGTKARRSSTTTQASTQVRIEETLISPWTEKLSRSQRSWRPPTTHEDEMTLQRELWPSTGQGKP